MSMAWTRTRKSASSLPRTSSPPPPIRGSPRPSSQIVKKTRGRAGGQRRARGKLASQSCQAPPPHGQEQQPAYAQPRGRRERDAGRDELAEGLVDEGGRRRAVGAAREELHILHEVEVGQATVPARERHGILHTGSPVADGEDRRRAQRLVVAVEHGLVHTRER